MTKYKTEPLCQDNGTVSVRVSTFITIRNFLYFILLLCKNKARERRCEIGCFIGRMKSTRKVFCDVHPHSALYSAQSRGIAKNLKTFFFTIFFFESRVATAFIYFFSVSSLRHDGKDFLLPLKTIFFYF